MATLETQYKAYLNEKQDSNLTFDEWVKYYGDMISNALEESGFFND